MFDAIEAYIKAHTKSYRTGFILTLIFGPLGLIYSSFGASAALVIIMAATSRIEFAKFAIWILSSVVGFFTVKWHNKKVIEAAYETRR
ncbi:hypothetical protein [Catenovulum agarivorans]|uniref:hypothetical protein n=1 Tax=Catenovulum agarivorans TaxID=1172192 RepID=UPI000382DAEA|nr:hypothetical protein [Catenovulum agarivorans]